MLKVRFDSEDVPLSQDWFVVARTGIIASWMGDEKPGFGANVRLLSFEAVVDRFGGKGPFNSMVRELLDFDFYAAWVAGD